jgi:hypothetical protein
MVHLWAAAGNSIISFAPLEDFNDHIAKLYLEGAHKAGREVQRGENIVIGGSLAISRDPARAESYAQRFSEWYAEIYGVPPFFLTGTSAQ